MKKFKTLYVSRYFLFLVFASITVLSSCSKEDDEANSIANVDAYVMVTNAAEGSASQDLLLDNTKVDGSTVAYAQSSNYLEVTSGGRQAKFANTGTATANAAFNLSLTGGQRYSLYYTGDASTSTSSYVITQDDLSAPESGKAKVRFIHLSAAAASAVDFGISGANKLVSGLAYRAASTYYSVNANTTFLLYASGAVSASLTIPTTLQAGKIYTIYVSGATQATISYHVVAQN